MGYFDGLADAAFNTDNEGRTIFFPWGVLGSGFIIQSPDQRDQIRNVLKKAYKLAFGAVIIITVTKIFWLAPLVVIAYCTWYYFTIREITKILAPTTDQLKFSAALRNSAKSQHLSTLIFLGLSSLGLGALGVWIVLIGKDPLIGYTSTGFFGLCAAAFALMIAVKINNT